MSPAIFGKLADAITGFELTITAWRPTIKLSQNKPADERTRVIDALKAQGHGALAHLMDQLAGRGERR